ncbi:hypothetical protein ACTXT7_002970 [Hymenolepis weldensis]
MTKKIQGTPQIYTFSQPHSILEPTGAPPTQALRPTHRISLYFQPPPLPPPPQQARVKITGRLVNTFVFVWASPTPPPLLMEYGSMANCAYASFGP